MDQQTTASKALILREMDCLRIRNRTETGSQTLSQMLHKPKVMAGLGFTIALEVLYELSSGSGDTGGLAMTLGAIVLVMLLIHAAMSTSRDEILLDFRAEKFFHCQGIFGTEKRALLCRLNEVTGLEQRETSRTDESGHTVRGNFLCLLVNPETGTAQGSEGCIPILESRFYSEEELQSITAAVRDLLPQK